MMTASSVRVTLGRKKLAPGLQQLSRVTTANKLVMVEKSLWPYIILLSNIITLARNQLVLYGK
jgi:hypothetical protein